MVKLCSLPWCAEPSALWASQLGYLDKRVGQRRKWLLKEVR